MVFLSVFLSMFFVQCLKCVLDSFIGFIGYFVVMDSCHVNIFVKSLQFTKNLPLQNDAKAVLQCLEFGKEAKQYMDDIRTFALTLHYYSPRAYQYVRNKFNSHLPDVSTMRSWISNCSGYGEPGICTNGLETLRILASDMKSKAKGFYCSVSFDEMYIKKHVQWSEAKRKFVGFISYGKKDENGELPVANQSLVFLVTGININISIPIAHFFIRSLNATEKSILIKEIITAITNTGAVVVNITFDGLAENFSACRMLGSSFELDNMRPYFINPVNKRKIFILLDSCHMLKLLRNHLGEVKEFGIEGKKIKWCYFERLEKCRVDKGLLTNKITKEHIEWTKNKLKVKLAAQLFSNSTAESLVYLRSKNSKGFEQSEATSQFSGYIDKLFDVLNSNKYEEKPKNVYKNAINKASAKPIFEFLDEISEYLKKIKIGPVLAINSPKKTGFLGFLINICSVKNIYQEYIETGQFDYLMTYHLSQDPLESLFSRMRTMNGNNDNPTTIQFSSALRKTRIHNETKSSHLANCADKLKIFTVSSASSRRKESSRQENLLSSCVFESGSQENIQTNNEVEHLELNENDFLLNCHQEVSLEIIASTVEKKINSTGRFDCNCKKVLHDDEKVPDFTISVGDLPPPCISTVYICKIVSNCLDHFKNQFDFNFDLLVEKIMNLIDFDNIYIGRFSGCESDHKIGFVAYLVEEFIRIHAINLSKNLSLVEKELMVRNDLRKKIHFLGL